MPSRQSEPAWLCEQHPDVTWPHGDCAGPGMLVFPPHDHAYDERGFCVVCRITEEEASRPACRHCGDAGTIPSADERYPDLRVSCSYCTPAERPGFASGGMGYE